MKKGVDKGLGVWYISKALGARGSAGAGRSRKLRGNRKKGLTNPGGRGKIAKFAGRGARMKSLGLSEKKLAKVEKGLDKRRTGCYNKAPPGTRRQAGLYLVN